MISHPLGKAFIKDLKKRVPFPLDEFPGGSEAKVLFNPFGLEIEDFVDEEKLYVLVLMKKHLSSHTKQFKERMIGLSMRCVSIERATYTNLASF